MPTTQLYSLSLHDALPIFIPIFPVARLAGARACWPRSAIPCCSTAPWLARRLCARGIRTSPCARRRSEEHTSELQSRGHLVCRLLLEKKNHCCRATII